MKYTTSLISHKLFKNELCFFLYGMLTYVISIYVTYRHKKPIFFFVKKKDWRDSQVRNYYFVIYIKFKTSLNFYNIYISD